MLTVAQGQVVTIPFTYVDGGGNPVAVDTPTVRIQASTGATAASGLIPTSTGTEGDYTLRWTVPATAALGMWRSEWSEAGPFAGQALFTVIAANPSTLATPTDVAVYTQKALTVTATAFCQQAINFLTGELETYLRRSLEPTWFDEVYTLEAEQTRVFLRNTPVLTVSAVYVNPDTATPKLLDATTYIVKRWGIIMADPTYQLLFRENASVWFGTVEGTQLEVQYQGGLDGAAHHAIKAAIVRAAAREYLAVESDVQNLSSFRGGTMLQYQFSDKNAGGFTDKELKRLRRYRRRIVS